MLIKYKIHNLLTKETSMDLFLSDAQLSFKQMIKNPANTDSIIVKSSKDQKNWEIVDTTNWS